MTCLRPESKVEPQTTPPAIYLVSARPDTPSTVHVQADVMDGMMPSPPDAHVSAVEHRRARHKKANTTHKWSWSPLPYDTLDLGFNKIMKQGIPPLAGEE